MMMYGRICKKISKISNIQCVYGLYQNIFPSGTVQSESEYMTDIINPFKRCSILNGISVGGTFYLHKIPYSIHTEQ
jgi:hypothetical protein